MNCDQESTQNGNGNIEGQDDDRTSRPSPPRFIFNCKHCGECCKRDPVIVTLGDLSRWSDDGTIMKVAHRIELDRSTGIPKTVLQRDDDGFCSQYHRDDERCTLKESRPMSCRAYPLSFDGSRFRVVSRECPGILDDGNMDHSALEEIREDARVLWKEIVESQKLLPIMEGLIMKNVMEQSMKMWENLDSDQKDQLLGHLQNEDRDPSESKRDRSDD